MSAVEDSVNSNLSLIPELEQRQDLMDISCQASDERENDNQEDTVKLINPTSKEFKKTWGFRRTTIAKREMPGEAECQDAPLRRSGRQSKRTDKMEEFLSSSKRRIIGRRSAPANLEGCDPHSQTATDVETASEASFDGSSELKASSQTSVENTSAIVNSNNSVVSGKLENSAAATRDTTSDDDDDDDDDSDELTLKELQNQLRKKRAEGVVQADSSEKSQVETEIGKVPESPKESMQSKEVKLKTTAKASKDTGLLGPLSSKAESEGYDPNALYCICRQKHNNRFMICCDRCEEWFHGNCVGITEARGRLLERNGEDYICPNCTRQTQNSDSPVTAEQSLDARSLEESMHQSETVSDGVGASEDQGIKGRIEKAANPSSKKKIKIFQPVLESGLPMCIGPGCTNQALPDSVYCGPGCILGHAAAAMKSLEVKQPKPKERSKQKVIKKTPPKSLPKTQKKNVPEKKPVKRLLVMVNKPAGASESSSNQPTEECPVPSWSSDHNYNAVKPEKTAAIASSVFYKPSSKEKEGNDAKVESAAMEKTLPLPPAAVSSKANTTTLTSPKTKKLPSPPSNIVPPKKNPVTSNNANSPRRPPSDLGPGLSSATHHASGALRVMKTSFTIPKKQPATSAGAPAIKPAAGSPAPPANSPIPKPTTPVAPQPQPNNQIRQNIRRSLTEILYKRVSDSDDLNISESEVSKISFGIEREMFGLCQATDSKYKNKYRSIMFNLKDPKNKGLFYRVIKGEISPFKLVRLSPEELLSKEMSEWKDKETTEVLESSQKSHREPHKFGLKQEVVPTVDMEESPPMSDTDEQEDPRPVQPASSVTVPDIFSTMLKDTTGEHRAHLFDLNCKICTGQMPAEEDPVPKKPKLTAPLVSKKPDSKIKQETSSVKAENAAVAQLSNNGAQQNATTAKTLEARPGSNSNLESQTNTTESPASPEASNISASNAPPLFPAVTSSSSISRRDPRTAGTRPNVTVTPSQSSSFPVTLLPSSPNPITTPAKDADNEAEKSVMPLSVPKSILMKPASSPDTRYFSSVSSSVSTAESRSPPEGETSAFLSKQEILWKGFINMHSVAKFVTKAYLVSGSIDYLAEDLPDTIHIGGRISPHTVWDYIGKLKSSLTKELCLIRFHPATEEEEVAYISLFSYFSSRGRFGVVANNNRRIKDLYLIPLSAKDSVPSKLLPFEGPGLESSRPNLLLGLVICQKLKRPGAQSDAEKVSDEKKSKIQIRDEDDSFAGKSPSLQKPEIKQEKPTFYSSEISVSTTPPGSPPLTTSSDPSSNTSSTASSVLPVSSTKVTTTTASVVSGAETTPSVPPASNTVSSTPLQHILNTLFGKKKPTESAETNQFLPQQSISEHTVVSTSAPLLDPIVQQFGQISKNKTLEDDEYDRPYDPEEEYDPGKIYGVDNPPHVNKLSEAENVSKAPVVEEEAYDPEDETIFEEAKVVISDFPSLPVDIKNREAPSNYISQESQGSSITEQQKMLDELNKQIEEQQRQVEEQEEALRQQRAAVGISMAHFSVSAALMSPPPKSSAPDSTLLQIGKKVEEMVKKSLPPLLINQRRDPRQSRDPRQAPSRRLTDDTEVVVKPENVDSVAGSHPAEANHSVINAEPEGAEVAIPLLGEVVDPYLSSSENAEFMQPGSVFGHSEQVTVSETLNSTVMPWPDSSSSLNSEDVAGDPHRFPRKVLLPTPSQPPCFPQSNDSIPSVSSSQPDHSQELPQGVSFLQNDHGTSMPQMGIMNSEFMSPQEALPAPFQPQPLVPQYEGETDQFREQRPPYPTFQEHWEGSHHLEGPRGPTIANMMGQRGPVPFQPVAHRGPPPQRFPGPPIQNMAQIGPVPGQILEAHGNLPHSFDGQNEPLQPRFVGPTDDVAVHFHGQRTPHPSFRGPVPGPFDNRGPHPSQFQGSRGPAPHQFSDHGPMLPLAEPQRIPEEMQYGNNSSSFQPIMEHHRSGAPPVPHMFRENRTSSPSPLMGQRVHPSNQFDGPRGPPLSPQFEGPRNIHPPAGGDITGPRYPSPNQFSGPRGPPPHLHPGQRVPSPQPRVPLVQHFDEHRGLHPAHFAGPRGPGSSQFSGPRAHGPSQFPDNAGHPRFPFEGPTHPTDGRPARHPRPLLPNPPEKVQEGWNKGRGQSRFGRGPEPEQLEHWQPAEARGKGRGRIINDSDSRNNPERQRERLEGPGRHSEERQNRLSEEKRRERDGARGRSRDKNLGKPWNRERDWERNRDRDSDRSRGRDWERHKDQPADREGDRNRDDQTRDRGRDRDRQRNRDRDRDQEKDSYRRRDRDRSRSRDRDRGRDRDRDRDRDHDRSRNRDRERDRDRERERDRGRDKERKERSRSKDKVKDVKPEAPKEGEKPPTEAETKTPTT